MSATQQAPVSRPARADERLAAVGLWRRLLVKPELGSLIGAVVIFAFFSAQSSVFRSLSGIANWLDVASTLGIMAVAVALLMIGGHFDLSAGVMTGTTGAHRRDRGHRAGQNIWVAIAVALVLALAIGFVNGWLVTRTGLPSFIITLGTFLMLQGLNLGLTKLFTGTVDRPADRTTHRATTRPSCCWPRTISVFGQPFRVAILWWLLVTAVATWVLLRTRFGNWVFATGGDEVASRNVGVPAARTTITLFMTTAAAAWLVGSITAVRLTSVQANTGTGQELIYIVAAVIGGCLLTGGFGSAIGAALGALVFGMTQQGIVYLRLGRRLVLLLPRGDAAARGAHQPAGAALRRGGPAMTAATGDAPLLELRGIGKDFGSVIALDDISTTVRAGEVTCVLGDNGAGKSTLIKMLVRRAPARPAASCCWTGSRSTSAPRARRWTPGIATVYQDLAMIPLMAIWRNFFLGSEPTTRLGPVPPLRRAHGKEVTRRGAGRDGHRHPRPRPAGRHAVRRRAAVGGDRPRGALRRAGADPGRADLGAGRQAGRRGAAVHRPGPRPRPRRRLHHPQPAPRLPGRRPVPAAQPRPQHGDFAKGRRQPGRADPDDGRRRRARPSSPRSWSGRRPVRESTTDSAETVTDRYCSGACAACCLCDCW